MPKLKTHKGAAKRFKKLKSGKIKRQHAKRGHLFHNKSSKKKRELRSSTLVSKADKKKVKRLLPY